MKQSLVDLPTTSSDYEQRKLELDIGSYRVPEVTQIMPVGVKETVSLLFCEETNHGCVGD